MESEFIDRLLTMMEKAEAGSEGGREGGRDGGMEGCVIYIPGH